MKLWAISDLHLDYQQNRRALARLPARPDDWLIVAGDISARPRYFHEAWQNLSERFARVIWAPGNHDLWTSREDNGLGGEAKYWSLVELCRQYGVLTPEDPFPEIRCNGHRYLIAPLFILYDYSFRPSHVAGEEALAWARDAGLWCRDEHLLSPAPWRDKPEMCRARSSYSRERLEAAPEGARLILVNHFPLRRDLVRLPRIPRFEIWCGTRRTEDWHRQFPVTAVVHGHLHMRATDYRDGVRFEEVSLGYPKQWDGQKQLEDYLRPILPEPKAPAAPSAGPFWHR